VIKKPASIFDRDSDWQALVEHVEQERAVPSLGVVSGRRRQGKTFMLTALAGARRLLFRR